MPWMLALHRDAFNADAQAKAACAAMRNEPAAATREADSTLQWEAPNKIIKRVAVDTFRLEPMRLVVDGQPPSVALDPNTAVVTEHYTHETTILHFLNGVAIDLTRVGYDDATLGTLPESLANRVREQRRSGGAQIRPDQLERRESSRNTAREAKNATRANLASAYEGARVIPNHPQRQDRATVWARAWDNDDPAARSAPANCPVCRLSVEKGLGAMCWPVVWLEAAGLLWLESKLAQFPKLASAPAPFGPLLAKFSKSMAKPIKRERDARANAYKQTLTQWFGLTPATTDPEAQAMLGSLVAWEVPATNAVPDLWRDTWSQALEPFVAAGPDAFRRNDPAQDQSLIEGWVDLWEPLARLGVMAAAASRSSVPLLLTFRPND